MGEARKSTPNDKLRRAREERCWLQQEVADKIYDLCLQEDPDWNTIITADQVGRWERGVKPSAKYQRKLCALFGKTPEECGFVTELDIPSPSPHKEHTSEGREPITLLQPSQKGAVSAHSISVPEGAVVFVVHNGTTAPMQTPTSPRQIDIQKENSAYSVEAVSPPQSPETPMMQGTGSEDAVNRREAGKKIITLGATLLTTPNLFGLMRVGALLYDEEILSVCATYIPIWWRLYFDGHISEVQHVLPDYLARLEILVRQSSSYQQQAASLASKASQLACMLTLQDQKFGNALIYARQGYQYGQLAEDPNLQAASLIRKALVYFYMKKPEQKLQVYQEALGYEAHVSPLLRARIYMGLSEAHSNLVARGDRGQEQEARHFLDLSYKTIPASPKGDPHFSYTHFGLPKGYESLFYLDLQQPRKAWDLLVAQSASTPMAIVPDRVTLFIRQTRALIALEEMEESCAYLEASIAASRALNSPLRIEETRDAYQQLLAKWPNERQTKDLADLFLA